MSSTAKSAVSAIRLELERGMYPRRSTDRLDTNRHSSFVEYETAADLAAAVEKLDNNEFKGATVRCISDVGPPLFYEQPMSFYTGLTDRARKPQSEIPRPRERYRSRSPGYRGGGRGGYGGPPGDDYYDRRGPPRGYSPRRDDYRRRTPPPRGGYYDDRDDRYGPPPPRGGRPPVDDYPPARGGYPADDRYGGPPPPRRGGYDAEPYANGHGGREPYGGRPRSPPREGGRGYDRGYDAPPPRGPYW